jgi:hypothetical protein
MLRTDGGYGVPGMPGNGAVAGGFNVMAMPSILRRMLAPAPAQRPPVRFDPNDSNIRFRSKNPTEAPRLRDQFILFDPRSGVANNPSPGGSPYSELPKDYLEQRNPFGTPPAPTQQPGQPTAPVQLELPLAMGSSNFPNALPGAPGNAAGMLMAQLPGGEQGPAQGPNTPVKFYPGLGYAPYVQRG